MILLDHIISFYNFSYLIIVSAILCTNRALSEVPNTNTIAGVRIGLIDDKFVVNPTTMEMENSKLDLLLAGSESGILMIEVVVNSSSFEFK